MSIYPTVRPSLTLDFKKSKQLDPRISFSRSSIATYVEAGVIKYADEHQARFEDDGLLIEESRTNVIGYSEDFTATGWTFATGAFTLSTPPSITAPDGSNNATLMVPNSADFYVEITYPTGLTGARTHSVFAKAEGKNYINLGARLNGGTSGWNIQFDLTTGAQTFFSTLVTGYSQQLANGWWRITAVIDATVAGGNLAIGACDQGNVTTTPDGTGIYIWGAQVENAATFSTSYIPTSGSTVTRAVDVTKITGTNFSSWYNQSEGTVVASIVNGNVGGASSFWSFDNGGSGNRWMFRFGVGLITTNFSTFSDTIRPYTATHACAIEDNGSSYAKDGVLFSPPTTVGVFLPGKTTLNLGDGPGVNPANGHLSRLSYYPERLTDEQLEAITS